MLCSLGYTLDQQMCTHVHPQHFLGSHMGVVYRQGAGAPLLQAWVLEGNPP